jgi:hypothetical protein
MDLLQKPSLFLLDKRSLSVHKLSALTVGSIKKGIWLYFFLIMFEGAFRKWFLPSLAGPLLIIRDPLALWILMTAFKHDLMNLKFSTVMVAAIGFFSIYTAFFIGHGNIYVALFGARILLLNFPLMFVIAQVFDLEDVKKVAKTTCIICIPMVLLIMLQFYSPQTAWINKTVGGEAGGGFDGALNFYRPPGTFSFTNGNTLFFDLAACFVIYFWFNSKEISRVLLISSTIALLLAIPFSMSRSLFFQVIISIIFALIPSLSRPKYIAGLIFILTVVFGVFVLLSFTSYFHTATLAFNARLDNGNRAEGGIDGVLLNRFLGGLIEAVKLSPNQPFFGYGIGMGTNAGSVLLSGSRVFLISEGEWGRIIGEIGPILGLTVIFIRLKLAASMLYQSFKRIRSGSLLPWIMSSVGIIWIAQGGWAQPTSLGFCTITTGLILAALKHSGTTTALPATFRKD